MIEQLGEYFRGIPVHGIGQRLQLGNHGFVGGKRGMRGRHDHPGTTSGPGDKILYLGIAGESGESPGQYYSVG
jgi:hypothetical protein